MLNNAGVCMSYQRTWDYLRQLTAEAEYLKVIRTGHWLWVYDNVNLHQRVRHERGGKCVHGGKHSRAYSSIMCTCTCIMIHVSTIHVIMA